MAAVAAVVVGTAGVTRMRGAQAPEGGGGAGGGAALSAESNGNQEGTNLCSEYDDDTVYSAPVW